MAFPAVRSISTGSGSSSSGGMSITLPSGYQTGDLLIVCAGFDGTIGDTPAVEGVIESGTGWTKRLDLNAEANQFTIYEKVADGTDSLSVGLVNNSVTEAGNYIAVAITGFDTGTARAFVGQRHLDVGGGSTSATPTTPSHTPAFGAEDALWIATCSWDNASRTLSSYPTNYPDNRTQFGSLSSSVGTALATRDLNTTTESAQTFTISAGDQWAAVSIAVKGITADPGDPPQGTTTISAVDPDITTAEITYSYDDTDADSFEYRINEGTAAAIGASPATITGLTANTAYNSPGIQVRAVNANGAGTWSTAQSFTTDAEPVDPPDTAPGGFTALAQSDTVIRLEWESVAGATGYDVEIDAGTPIDVGLVLTYDAIGLTASTEYDFRVRAYNTAGDGPWTSVVSETTNPEPPATGLYLEFSLDNYVGVPLESFALPRICVGTATSYSTVTAFFDDVVTSSSGVILLDLGTESGLTAGQWVWIWSAESIGTPGETGFENNGFIIRREVLSAE
jgi:hypothetical protein